jgi:hypothetical protein
VNKAIQPILARLEALSTPSQVAPGGARVIADLAHPSPMAALLREVNETILSRSLRVESSGGSSLTLDIAGRRVLRLTEATGVPGAERCLAAETLDDDHKGDLIQVLQTVATRRHELRVTSRPLPGAGDAVSVGLPVAVLADLVQVELNEVTELEPEPPAAPEPAPAPAAPVLAVVPPATPDSPEASAFRSLTDFAAQVGPALTAWLVRGGPGDGAAEGPDEFLGPLRSFVEEEGASVQGQLDRVAQRPGAEVCLVLGATLVEGHSVVCARAGDGLLLGVIEGGAAPALLRAWTAVPG